MVLNKSYLTQDEIKQFYSDLKKNKNKDIAQFGNIPYDVFERSLRGGAEQLDSLAAEQLKWKEEQLKNQALRNEKGDVLDTGFANIKQQQQQQAQNANIINQRNIDALKQKMGSLGKYIGVDSVNMLTPQVNTFQNQQQVNNLQNISGLANIQLQARQQDRLKQDELNHRLLMASAQARQKANSAYDDRIRQQVLDIYERNPEIDKDLIENFMISGDLYPDEKDKANTGVETLKWAAEVNRRLKRKPKRF